MMFTIEGVICGRKHARSFVGKGSREQDALAEFSMIFFTSDIDVLLNVFSSLQQGCSKDEASGQLNVFTVLSSCARPLLMIAIIYTKKVLKS